MSIQERQLKKAKQYTIYEILLCALLIGFGVLYFLAASPAPWFVDLLMIAFLAMVGTIVIKETLHGYRRKVTKINASFINPQTI